MMTDFKHYLFSFHDQFIEVIARGFWFEKSETPLFGKKLMEGHPFLPLSEKNAEKITAHSLTAQIRKMFCIAQGNEADRLFIMAHGTTK